MTPVKRDHGRPADMRARDEDSGEWVLFVAMVLAMTLGMALAKVLG